MKSSHSLALGLAVFLTAIGTTSIRAEDWTTTDGQVYHEVVVVKVEPDAVTILHHDGGGLIPLLKLSPELRKRFNYDPAAAEAAAVARVQADAANALALQAEIEQARIQKQLKLQAQDAQTPPSTGGGNATDAGSFSASDSSNSVEASHHSISELIGSMQGLRLDPSEPGHHTTSSLLISSHNLDADLSDPNHHTRDQLFSSDPLSGRQ